MSTQATGGVGFLGILALIFITLKLTGHITWSWIWVLAPIWIPTVLGVALLLIGLGLALLVDLYVNFWRRR